ncbi:hypothetical protein H206_05309 [Candidatus Electrothrix aarhusensis]|uniref:Uncharacterized protein n=1 Tax=Candidatus Electrothrix aarhusensis TaxID=1859131 RepID=A0A444J4W4_9BACT|nr:hypothetical protein H206_05309 [Candidatus Electrothrix aarhusensis]
MSAVCLIKSEKQCSAFFISIFSMVVGLSGSVNIVPYSSVYYLYDALSRCNIDE